MLFERFKLLLVDEDLEVAGMGEVDLGGEECRGLDALVLLLGMQRQCRGQQRAADAVADGVDILLAGRLLDCIKREIDALAGIGPQSLSAWRASGLTQEMTKTV